MQMNFYKSLDRQVDILGLKGKWITLFLAAAGGSLVVGILAGTVAGSSGVAIAAVIFLVAISFFVCLMMQAKIPSKRVDRTLFGRSPECVVTRRESLSRIIYPDMEYEKFIESKKLEKGRS